MKAKGRVLIIIAVIAILIVGGIVYAVTRPDSNGNTGTTGSNGSNAADAPRRNNGANSDSSRAQPQPAPNQPVSNPTQLADTGAGSVYMYSVGSGLIAGLGHFVISRRKRA